MQDKPQDPDERRSSVGLEFSVSIQIARKRAVYQDHWEARLTTLAIAVVSAVVLVLVILQVFQLLGRIFTE